MNVRIVGFLPPSVLRFVVISCGACVVCAANGAEDNVAAHLKRLYPATQFSRIEPSPVSGLTQVVMGRTVAYVDPSGRYFLFGRLYDMQAQQDLTAPLLEGASRIAWQALPITDAIVTTRGAGTRRLAVFTDPDCPYCRALEKTLGQLDDITVYTFLVPVAALHPEAPAKAAAIWCAPDRARALEAVLVRNEPLKPAATECATPIARNLALAARLAVRGTPALFAGDGRRLDGAADLPALQAFLTATP